MISGGGGAEGTDHILTLPVRRYLVPTHSMKGGGGGGGLSRPHDFGEGRLYNLQLWQAIKPIYER